jgi:hypothetical protein
MTATPFAHGITADRAKKSLIAVLVGAFLAISFIAPGQSASGMVLGKNVGNMTPDCALGSLESQTVLFLEIGDYFSIENDGNRNCKISDPNNILIGEDGNVSGLGAGILASGNTLGPIMIMSAGTFTINEDSDPTNIRTIHVKPGLVFANPAGDIFDNAAVGDTYTYDEVFITADGTRVGATITVNELSNLFQFQIDRDDRPDTDAGIGNGITRNGENAFAEYTVSFHAAGNPNSPIVLDNFTVTVKDIDNSQWFSATNASSYALSSTPATNLTARTVGSQLFIEELNDVESENENEDHWGVVNFASKSSVTFRVGMTGGASASFNILFADSEWSANPTTIAVAGSPNLAATGTDSTALETGLVLSGLFVTIGVVTSAALRRRRA